MNAKKQKLRSYQQIETAEILRHLTHKHRIELYLTILVTTGLNLIRKSSAIRLSIIHAITTFATLALFPPANAVPPIALPIVWAASLSVSLAILSLLKLIPSQTV